MQDEREPGEANGFLPKAAPLHRPRGRGAGNDVPTGQRQSCDARLHYNRSATLLPFNLLSA
jgi:hypothetical protein